MDANARISCGDALQVLRTLPAGFAALTVTSPPYYRQRDYRVGGQIGQEKTLDAYLERLAAVLRELRRVTDDKGSCFVVIGDTYRNGKLLLVPHRVLLLADEMGWHVRNDVIWHKTSPPPESPRTRWRSGHEHVLFLAKRPSGYRFDADDIRVPYAQATLRRWGAGQAYGGRKSASRKSSTDSRMRDGQTFRLNPLGCVPTDVWSCAGANAAAGHYAAFPDHLIRTIITACSKRGDMVLDPFVGSGTTCVVAASLGRRSFGVDLNPEYASMAKEALRRALKGRAA